ncbi:hypothetical protein [Leptothermofonsia sp. ETS-13]|uniref:hypothetical protein n=1 Tax=Leptothermofonsia sp. ETS-13 TaxID=3035696 RepID=UPI003BA05473
MIGMNGVGKSSILDCLAILLQELILSQILDKLNLKRNFTAADFKAKHREIYVEILLTANSQTGKLSNWKA